MAKQYIRKYSLTIIGNSSKVITELRIKFEITKSQRSYPNIATIELYNPNEETIGLLNADPLLVLNAGYDGNLGLIFRGRIRNLFVNKVGVDRIVTIYAGDGERDWQQATYNKTVSENLNVKDIVLELINTFNISGDIGVGELQGLDVPADKLRGQSLSGSSKDILDNIADDYNFQWSIQDGEVTIVEEDKVLDSQAIVLVKRSTGMIGSPTLTEIGADVTTLLNPELLPNRSFRIESETTEIGLSNIQFRNLKKTRAEGDYKAFEVQFVGDTHSNEWYSIVKGNSLNV